ncbi:MAG TPA: CARDB domain-containing protein [Actinomycetota bacterium]|nr:CARDB domain-containing protein [Actinomycetota bacterium]
MARIGRTLVVSLVVGLVAGVPAAFASHKGDSLNDLVVTQSASPDAVVEGEHVTYRIEVANRGPHPALEIQVNQVVSGGTIVSASGHRWECPSIEAGRASCRLHGSLSPGGTSAPLLVVVQAAVDGGSQLSSTATALSHGTEINPPDNVSTLSVGVAPGTELGVSMYDTPDPVTSGANVKYGISVTNNGDASATGVSVTHQVSTGETTSFFGDGWDCALAARTASCALADPLGAGVSAPELSVVVRAPETSTRSSIRATASVSAANQTSAAEPAEQTTTVDPAGQDFAIGYIPPEGGCLTTNPTGICTSVGGSGGDAFAPASSASSTPVDSGATPTNNTFGDVSFEVGPGGVASLFEGSSQLAICAQLRPFEALNCAGAALDVIVPPGYDDRRSPIAVNLVYDNSVAPASEDPRTVYAEKPVGGQTTTFILTPCGFSGFDGPTPCVDFQHRIAGDDLLIRILMISQDPKYQG